MERIYVSMDKEKFKDTERKLDSKSYKIKIGFENTVKYDMVDGRKIEMVRLNNNK